MCLAQGPQRSDAGEARTRGTSVSSQALYHRATALPRCVSKNNYFHFKLLFITKRLQTFKIKKEFTIEPQHEDINDCASQTDSDQTRHQLCLIRVFVACRIILLILSYSPIWDFLLSLCNGWWFKTSKSWTFEIQILKLAVCLQNINKSSLNA